MVGFANFTIRSTRKFTPLLVARLTRALSRLTRMRRFSLRTLLAGFTIVALSMATYPTASQVIRWYSGQNQLLSFSKTNYLKYGYEDVNTAARPVFEQTIEELRKVEPFTNDKEKLAILEHCVQELNKIQYDETIKHSIESVEREMYCDIVLQLGDFVGVDFQPLLDETRDF